MSIGTGFRTGDSDWLRVCSLATSPDADAASVSQTRISKALRQPQRNPSALRFGARTKNGTVTAAVGFIVWIGGLVTAVSFPSSVARVPELGRAPHRGAGRQHRRGPARSHRRPRLIVHGMLTRIVPFLVWFHRFSSLVGSVPVPPMRQLWPARFAGAGLGLHLATVLLGAADVGTGSALVARVAGGGLVLTGVSLGAALARVLSAPVPR